MCDICCHLAAVGSRWGCQCEHVNVCVRVCCVINSNNTNHKTTAAKNKKYQCQRLPCWQDNSKKQIKQKKCLKGKTVITNTFSATEKWDLTKVPTQDFSCQFINFEFQPTSNNQLLLFDGLTDGCATEMLLMATLTSDSPTFWLLLI